MKDIVICENIKFNYLGDEKKIILNNVSIAIQKGSFVSVLGRNGSGKSTLAKLIDAGSDDRADRRSKNSS